MRVSLFILFLILTNGLVMGQTVVFKGTVTDSLQNPLAFANIIAEPITETEMRFTMTDEEGRFQLKLEKSHTYKIRISFLGYKTETFNLKTIKNSYKNIVLTESSEMLSEVKINAKLAVLVKEDTTVYQTKHFINGKERKLKEVLQKLPGVEVDRNSNVTVQGKRVSRVLVEDKVFFTGDTKLAVDNIPANAVKEVQVLDNYTDVALLKGLEDSEEMVMNIKLKEDKKRFWFGDIEVGGGIEKRYLFHPSLFYYSPKTSVNIIGDFNNTGKKSFTFKNYLDFEGGYNKLRLQPKAYFSKMNDDFAKFLRNQDFVDNKHLFVGGNINQTITSSSDLIGYVIYSKNKNQQKNTTFNQYNVNETPLLENRTTTHQPNNNFIIGKIGYKNELDNGGKFKIESLFKKSDNFNKGITETYYAQKSKYISTHTSADNISLKQNAEWYTEITDKQTMILLANYNYSKGNSSVNWQTDNAIFPKTLPIKEQETYSVFKDKDAITQQISTLAKHYWKFAKFIHLYNSVGISAYLDKYQTEEYQKLSTKQVNYFNKAGFGNDINFAFMDNFITTQLKFQIGKMTVKPEISYHNYYRVLKFNQTQKSINKKYFLPAIDISLKLKKSQRIKLKYGLKALFPSVVHLANNYTLTNFNSIYKGNIDLENELYHQVYGTYTLFSLYNGIIASAFVNYTKKKKTVKRRNELIGINSITQPVLIDNADENKSISGRVTKMLENYNLSLKLGVSQSNYLQFLNDNLQKNKSNSYHIGGGFKTKFSEFPNIEMRYKKTFSNYQTSISSKTERDNFEAYLDYVVDDFVFKADYTHHFFKNKTYKTSEKNNLLNVYMSYQKENSPWFFSISANNLLNNSFKIRNSFSDFLISESKTFLMPRTIVFSISYKL